MSAAIRALLLSAPDDACLYRGSCGAVLTSPVLPLQAGHAGSFKATLPLNHGRRASAQIPSDVTIAEASASAKINRAGNASPAGSARNVPTAPVLRVVRGSPAAMFDYRPRSYRRRNHAVGSLGQPTTHFAYVATETVTSFDMGRAFVGRLSCRSSSCASRRLNARPPSFERCKASSNKDASGIHVLASK